GIGRRKQLIRWRRGVFQIYVVHSPEKWRPCPDVLSRDINTSSADNPQILQQLGREGVSDLQILETDIRRIHHVFGLLFTKYPSVAVCQPRYISREEGIRILRRPDDPLFQVPHGHISVWSVVLSPENIRFIAGIPILLANALEEGAKKESIPVRRQVYAERIARRPVAD